MNLASTIYLHAGGPGSGCNGPNCGRPARTMVRNFSDHKQVEKLWNTHYPKGDSPWTHGNVGEDEGLHYRVLFDEQPNGSFKPVAMQSLLPQEKGVAYLDYLRSHRSGAAEEMIKHMQKEFRSLNTQVTNPKMIPILEKHGFTKAPQSGPWGQLYWEWSKRPKK